MLSLPRFVFGRKLIGFAIQTLVTSCGLLSDSIFFCSLVTRDFAVIDSAANVQSFFFCVLHGKPPVRFGAICVHRCIWMCLHFTSSCPKVTPSVSIFSLPLYSLLLSSKATKALLFKTFVIIIYCSPCIKHLHTKSIKKGKTHVRYLMEFCLHYQLQSSI